MIMHGKICIFIFIFFAFYGSLVVPTLAITGGHGEGGGADDSTYDPENVVPSILNARSSNLSAFLNMTQEDLQKGNTTAAVELLFLIELLGIRQSPEFQPVQGLFNETYMAIANNDTSLAVSSLDEIKKQISMPGNKTQIAPTLDNKTAVK
jgi:hypothetical protein